MTQNQISLDSYLSLIDSMNQLTEDEKIQLRNNCGYAIQSFGQDWIQNEESRLHPLWGYFGSSIGISLLGEVGEALQNLKTKEHFNEIVKRLHDSTQFEGAHNEIIIGNTLYKKGIGFEFENQIGNRKNPDIVLKFPTREIYLEITEKITSREYRKASSNAHKITSSIFSLKKNYSCFILIHRPLSDSRTEELLQQCQEMTSKVIKTEYEEYHIKDVIDIYFFNVGLAHKVPIEHRTISATMPKVDEIARIKTKINKKSSQLHADKPGILLIIDNDFWPIEDDARSNINLKNQLEEHIFDHPNISALIILNNFVGAGYRHNELFIEDETFFVMQTHSQKTLFSTNKLAIFNKYAKKPLFPKEREILIKI